MSWLEPGPSTKIPPKLVKLTDTIYPISKSLVPAVLSVGDIRREAYSGSPCSMRVSLERSGHMVEPPFPGRGKVVK